MGFSQGDFIWSEKVELENSTKWNHTGETNFLLERSHMQTSYS